MADEDNKQDFIYVGDKPIGAYIKAIDMQYNKSQKVTMASRGKFITKLVNIAEISKRNGYKVENITIGSEPFKNKEGKDIFVSFMEIILVR